MKQILILLAIAVVVVTIADGYGHYGQDMPSNAMEGRIAGGGGFPNAMHARNFGGYERRNNHQRHYPRQNFGHRFSRMGAQGMEGEYSGMHMFGGRTGMFARNRRGFGRRNHPQRYHPRNRMASSGMEAENAGGARFPHNGMFARHFRGYQRRPGSPPQHHYPRSYLARTFWPMGENVTEEENAGAGMSARKGMLARNFRGYQRRHHHHRHHSKITFAVDAVNALKAHNSINAHFAHTATNVMKSENAGVAGEAKNAMHARYAEKSKSAMNAKNAKYAKYAYKAKYAYIAENATHVWPTFPPKAGHLPHGAAGQTDQNDGSMEDMISKIIQEDTDKKGNYTLSQWNNAMEYIKTEGEETSGDVGTTPPGFAGRRARYAINAMRALNAVRAKYARNAINAYAAKNAGKAKKAKNALYAEFARNAYSARNAKNTIKAKNAKNAEYAMYAKFAEYAKRLATKKPTKPPVPTTKPATTHKTRNTTAHVENENRVAVNINEREGGFLRGTFG